MGCCDARKAAEREVRLLRAQVDRLESELAIRDLTIERLREQQPVTLPAVLEAGQTYWLALPVDE